MDINNYKPAPDLLKDRVILLTGAGGGIGAEAAKAYAAHGATVVLLGRTISKLEKIYDDIKAAGGPEPALYPLNLEGAIAKDYDEMATAIKTELGQLNGILHNAAFVGEATPLKHYDAELWARVLHVNLTAPFMLTRACLNLMQHSDDPRIVFTTHRADTAYWGAYGVAKAAVERLMGILADELDTGGTPSVAVNALEPGEVLTPLMSRVFPGRHPDELPPIETVLPAYLYVMGADSRGVTGEVISAQTGQKAKA